MPDTRRTFAALATLFADNTAGAISAQDLRDFLQSMTVHTAAAAPGASDDETLGFDAGHVWKNTASTPDSFHMCLSPTTDAAVWAQIYPATAAWGGITGTLADQTDLQTALAGKATSAQGALADTAVQPGDDAADLGSGAATDGYVLTADGVGGAAWEAVPGASAPTQSFVIACSDETTDLTTGTAKVTFRMPFAFTLTAVRASVTTAPTDAALQVDINESGASILSTVLSIDSGEKTSTTAATAAVISDSSLADDAEITIDIDQVGSTVAGAGLKVTLIGTKT